MRRIATLVLAALLGGAVTVAAPAPGGAAVGVGSAAAGDVVSVALRAGVARLPVAAEVRAGYDRDLFPHWIDADGDRCTTRNEVLIAEATRRPTVGARCALSGGRWYSYYDNRHWTVPGDLDIDHMVALAEAWDSGARRWTTARRQRYANDLGDPRALVAVTDNVNQAKGDRDPATWLPPYGSARCRYLAEWVAVKIRWRLSVDVAERSTLVTRTNACPNVTLTVTRAS